MSGNNKVVMAGLVPAIHELHQPVVKVVPTGVHREDQTHFPGSGPMLHVVLQLNRGLDVSMPLRVDEPFQAIPLRKSIRYACSMLPDSTGEIAGHAYVQCAVRAISHDVDPGSIHPRTLGRSQSCGNAFVDGRDTPGHDDQRMAVGASGVGHDGRAQRCSPKS